MSDHARPNQFPSADSPDESPATGTGDSLVDSDELLSLLGDEYARDILATLGEESLPARELVGRSDASRPTVYRRLNRLEAAGIVETVMTVHPEGHHRKEFRVTVDELAVSFENGSLRVDVEDEPSDSETGEPLAIA